MRWSVIIVNYRSSHVLEGCLRTLGPTEPDEVVVVDNWTTADEREAVRRLTRAAGARLVEPDRNLGFAPAHQRVFPELTGDGFLLLNPDTEVPSNLLTHFGEILQDAEVGAVGPLFSMDRGGQVLIPPNLGTLTVNLFLRPWSRRLPPLGRWMRRRTLRRYLNVWTAQGPIEVPTLSGACLALTRQAVEQAGGLLDDRFFLYGEDEDLGLRLRRAGLRLVQTPGVRVTHFVGGHTAEAMGGPLFQRAVRQLWDKHRPCSGRLLRRLDGWLGGSDRRLDREAPTPLPHAPPTRLSWADRRPGFLLLGLNDSFAPAAGMPVKGGSGTLPEAVARRLAPATWWLRVIDRQAECLAGNWLWSPGH